MLTPRILNYQDVGDGPTVVLLHGYLASSQYWANVIQELSVKNRVIAIDLLGFGKSPKPYLSKYDYQAQVASIHATLRQIGLRRKFTLMGHSMGALIALRYASDHQSQIKKLVLANMPIFLSRQEAKKDILNSNIMYKIGLRRGLHSFVWPLFVITTQLRILPSKVAEGAVERRKYLFQNTAASRLRSMRNVIYGATIEADLLKLEIATTMVSGLRDRKQYLHNLPKLRQARHIMSRTIDGGHHLPITHPRLFAELV